MYAATRIALYLCILHNNNPLLYIYIYRKALFDAYFHDESNSNISLHKRVSNDYCSINIHARIERVSSY